MTWVRGKLFAPTASSTRAPHPVAHACCCVAAEEDSYTKEETKSTKFVNLVHAASLNQASAVASEQPHGTTSGDLSAAMSGLTQSVAADSELPSTLDDDHSDGSSWPSLQPNAWGAKGATASAQVTALPRCRSKGTRRA